MRFVSLSRAGTPRRSYYPVSSMAGDGTAKKSRLKLPAIKGRLLWILLSIVAVSGLVYAAGFHVTSLLQGPIDGVIPLLIYNVSVVAAYLAIYKLISDRYRSRPSSSVRVFWTPIVSGIIVLALGYYISRLGRLDNLESLGAQIDVLGFDLDTGRPLALATIFKMNVLTILQVVFAFLLLLGFRSLVLVKRTRASQRNWYLLIAFMVFASITVFMKPARLELTLFQRLALLPAVVFMVINSIQLSWIAFLSFKEKLASILLSTVLLAVLILIGFMDEAVTAGLDVIKGNYRYMKHYSYPLGVFTSLTVIFGVIYSSTAFLSLLFHLPTTRAFRQKAGELAAMQSFSTLVGQVLESEKLFSTVVESPVSAEIAESGWLALADSSAGTLKPQVVSAVSFGRNEIEKMVDVSALFDELNTTRQPIHLEHAVADHRIKARPGDGLGSVFGIPLVARNECLGALFFAKSMSRAFEPDDLEAITGFAAQAAMALDNSRLFTERLEMERLERELSIAREVQQKLLPQRLPALDGLSIAATSVPALEVGGDYYDFLEVDDHRLAVIVADVSGKGTSAAFYMAELQGIFKSVAQISPEPDSFLSAANRALRDLLEKNVFISVIYALLDTETGVVQFARAGHCPVAISDLSGTANFVRSRGMGLGLDPGPVFSRTLEVVDHQLQPGDVFVLYTDGLVESRSENGDEYGYERLLDALAENRHEDAFELHNALVRDLNGFVVDGQYGDDMTIVIMKWHGAASVAPELTSLIREESSTTM